MKRRYFAGIFLMFLIIGVFTAGAESDQVVNYTITATGSGGGTIEPSGIVEVAAGTGQTFIMTPDPSQLDCWGSGKRYVVWNVTVDGQVVGDDPLASSQPVLYNFTGVQENHTIHAEFTYALINARPFARFTSDTTSGPVPLTVNFSQVLVSNNTGILWSFGDTTTSTDPNPVHTYTSPGIYDASFTIFCDNTSYSELPLEISVMEPPVANFTVNTTFGVRPLTVQFTDTSTGSSPLNYTWDFGDQTSSYDQNPVHTYTDTGSYQVSLTVSNGAGNDTKTAGEPIGVIGPIGGNKGYFLVHCNVDGAKVYFDDNFKGVIGNGTLNVMVYTTAAPYYTYSVEKDGYQLFRAPITEYPGKDQTVDLYVELVPSTVFYFHLQDGWNLFSTPVTLDPENETLLSIFDEIEQEKVLVVLGWNGSWFIPDESYALEPLDALYIFAEGSPRAALIPSSAVTPPPARSLAAGISLIGPAPSFTDGGFPTMPLDQALISIDQTAGGGTGYLMVISPGLNQPGWAFARGGAIQDIEPFRGYWVVMENPDTLYGFSTTPFSI